MPHRYSWKKTKEKYFPNIDEARLPTSLGTEDKHQKRLIILKHHFNTDAETVN